MVVVGDADGRGLVVICDEIITNSAVHSRPGFQSNGWGWIPDSMVWIPDSREWIPDYKALDSGFRRQKMLNSGFRIPLHGAIHSSWILGQYERSIVLTYILRASSLSCDDKIILFRILRFFGKNLWKTLGCVSLGKSENGFVIPDHMDSSPP